ncbi:MAG TPA: GNAT family N-acetyltransferase [Gemmatimonadales bacterium]|nr:GNAT family N-acetyltransferase [Gemmatimonadales bacterium]
MVERLPVRSVRASVDCIPLGEALTTVASEWEALRERSPAASPFASWAWHQAWAAAAVAEDLDTSRTVLLRGATGAVEAILPLAIRSTPFRRERVTALTWAIGDVGCPDHLDIPALPGADFDAVLPVLTSLPWDVAILSNLAPGSANATRLAAALLRGGCAVRWQEQWACPYIELPGSWEEYLGSLSPSRRQALRRRERALHRAHPVTLTDYDSDTLDTGWQHLVALHARRWAGDGGGVFADPRIERLHRAFAAELARREQLWLTTLDVNGEPTAAWYGFADRDTVYFYQSGRDPRRDDLSVGAVLMAHMIRRSIERGYRRFDFLRGEEAYKLQWTALRRMTGQFVAFRPGWRGQWLRGLDLASRLWARLRPRRRGHGSPPAPAAA